MIIAASLNVICTNVIKSISVAAIIHIILKSDSYLFNTPHIQKNPYFSPKKPTFAR